MNFLETARDYIRRGFSVIPVNPKTKKPVIESWKVYQYRKPTDDELIQWFGNGSRNNIAIVTGEISGIVVVDFDSEEAIKLAKEKGVPATPLVKTNRGYHAYFKYKEGVRNFQKRDDLPGIDLRGDGGYIIAPPSKHKSGAQYTWVRERSLDDLPRADLPNWILARNPEQKKPLKELYQGVTQGNRNDSLARLVGSWVNDDLSYEECLDNAHIWNSKNNPPLSKEEIERTVESIYEKHHREANEGKHNITAINSDPNILENLSESENNWPVPDEAMFYGLAGEIVRTIEPHTESDPVAILVQSLIAFGNSIGRSAHYKVEADKHYMNLFAVLTGATSKGRKGTSWGHVQKAYKNIDPDWANQKIQSGLSSGEGVIWSVRDQITKTEAIRDKKIITGYQDVIIDQGIKDKRLLAFAPEFAAILKVANREGNILSDVIRQAWDNGDLRIMTKNTPAQATGAHISIIGHITKQELIRYLNSTEAANGFANRFLWACVNRSKYLSRGGNLQDQDLFPLIEKLKQAKNFAQSAGVLAPANKTWSIWDRVYPELSKDSYGLVGAVTSRAEAQVMRLACIYALLDCSITIRPEHLTAALALWEYCEASAKYIFGSATGNPTADKIFEALKDNPNGMSKTYISNLFSRNLNKQTLAKALDVLLKSNKIYKQNMETDGRPGEVFFIKNQRRISTK